MDISSFNLYNLFFKSIYTFGLHHIPWQWDPNFNNIVCEEVLPLALNLLPDPFIGCLQLYHKKYWLITSYSPSPQHLVLQTSITSHNYTHPHSSFLPFNLCYGLCQSYYYFSCVFFLSTANCELRLTRNSFNDSRMLLMVVTPHPQFIVHPYVLYPLSPCALYHIYQQSYLLVNQLVTKYAETSCKDQYHHFFNLIYLDLFKQLDPSSWSPAYSINLVTSSSICLAFFSVTNRLLPFCTYHTRIIEVETVSCSRSL